MAFYHWNMLITWYNIGGGAQIGDVTTEAMQTRVQQIDLFTDAKGKLNTVKILKLIKSVFFLLSGSPTSTRHYLHM